MDHGPFVSTTLATDPVTEKAIVVKVGTDTAVAFDTDLLRVSTAWTGGFLNWYAARDGLQNWPTPVGTPLFSTQKAPGWTRTGVFTDPRSLPVGPLPKTWGHYKGLYLSGDQTVFSYTVGSTQILESPGAVMIAERAAITRTFNVAGTSDTLSLRILDLPDGALLEQEPEYVRIRRIGKTEQRLVGFRGLPSGAKSRAADGHLVLDLPSVQAGTKFELIISPALTARVVPFQSALATHLQQGGPVPDLSAARPAAEVRWPAVETQPEAGTGEGPFLVDTFTIPEANPWKSWIRLSGMDFLDDGRAVVSSVTGDVWVVSGIGPTLGTLSWKRFATGLNQPLGVKVVKNRVYVTGRDQITILNDRNNDGEADFYENFNNDFLAADNFHEFTMHLESDSNGNFYVTKGTAWPAVAEDMAVPPTPHNGTLMRLPPDGSRVDVVASGLRHPNGFAIGPGDQMVFADNQGNWLPTSVLHMIRPGGVYGFVPTAHTPERPKDFEKPIVWLPHAFDNSPGSPVWVTSPQWGPLTGKMLLTSYGKATLSLVLIEQIDGQVQGAVMNLPLRFVSGLMRARFRPDGHLYLAGLSNWQSEGARKGGFHRVRYTGKAVHLPLAFNVRPTAIELTFSDALDAKLAVDPQSYDIQQANYRWHAPYGSPMYKVSNPEQQGTDPLNVSRIRLSRDRKTVTLEIPDLQPVQQMQISYILRAADGAELRHTLHATINRVPGSGAQSSPGR
jgi:glucose/arabinose dehydrogenase